MTEQFPTASDLVETGRKDLLIEIDDDVWEISVKKLEQ